MNREEAAIQALQAENDDLKKQVAKLEDENAKLDYIITNGNISSIEDIVSNFKSVAKDHLSKLTRELCRYHASSDERQCLLEFLEYLNFVIKELEKFLIRK